MQIIFHEEVESTNILARDMARQGASPETVVWAGRQTGGRGQHGRGFASPQGGLYFSVILAPDLPIERLSMVTLAAGVGCALSLEQMCGIVVRLKWPNDLYCEGKKIGGILTEGVPARKDGPHRVVVGVGINVNSRLTDFPSRLHQRLTSVYMESGREFALEQLLETCCCAIIDYSGLLLQQPDKLLALWESRDYCNGRRLRWETGMDLIHGTGRGIMADGRYCLEADDGCLHAILAGRIRPLEEK